jgi:site-specific DNA-methyltransferase (adenine-specific)
VDSGSIRLLFADPPFNLNREYDDSFNDNRPAQEYLTWTKEWLSMVPSLLTDDGSFWLTINEKWVAEAKVMCTDLGLTLRSWIIWHYSFGQAMTTKFAKSNTHILWFTKHPKEFIFNDMLIRVPSLRQIEYGDKRANPNGKVPDSTWSEFSRVCGTFSEKQIWHDNQMPEPLMHRIVRASSKLGDIVLDPFSGSATTLVAAERLGRTGRGIEISENYALLGEQRVEAAISDPENTIKATGKWGAFHAETAEWLLRETGVSSKRIINRTEALKCFTRLLNARSGGNYSMDEVAAQLPSIEKKITSRFVP